MFRSIAKISRVNTVNMLLALKISESRSTATSIADDSVKVEGKAEVIDVDAEMIDAEANERLDTAPASAQRSKSPSAEHNQPSESATQSGQDQSEPKKEQSQTPTPNGNFSSATPVAGDASVIAPALSSAPSQRLAQPEVFPGGYPVDVPFEASKLPLDVAIYNSARAAGGDDRIRKYLQAVLIVGGGALTPGIVHALESR